MNSPTPRHRGPARESALGFTLIELMMGVALMAIILGLAVPSFTTMIRDNRLVAQTNELVTSLALARAEAAKLGRSVFVCPSTTGTACSGSNWEGGWTVTVDFDGSGGVNAADTVVRLFPAISGGNTLRANNGAMGSWIALRPSGIAIDSAGDQLGTNDTFFVCDKRGGAYGRQVAVNVLGASTVTVGGATCP